MKKTLITLALVATTLASFGQGKITIGNDSLHLITDGTNPLAVAGGFSGLTMELWAGTAAGSLTLRTSFVGNAINSLAVDPGRINNTSYTLTGIAGGTTAYIQLLFTGTIGGLAATGSTPVFSVTAGSFAPNSIVLGPPGGSSTWAAGNVAVTTGVVPEPSSMVLAGLGAASLLLFRRRK